MKKYKNNNKNIKTLDLSLKIKKKKKKKQASDRMKLSNVEASSRSVKGGKALKVRELNISRQRPKAFCR